MSFESDVLRASARLLAASNLDRRLDACRRFGVERHLDDDPVGRVVTGGRDRHGLTRLRTTVPLGVVAMTDPTPDLIADAVLCANAVAVKGLDDETATRIRSGLLGAGLPESGLTVVERFAGLELDAVRKADGELVVAERPGAHRHIYLDASAEENIGTYVSVNAVSRGVVDTIIFHTDYPAAAVGDIMTALGHLEVSATMVQARSLGEALDVIDARSAGTVECFLAGNVRIADELRRRLDAAVVVHNASPAFIDDVDVAAAEVTGFVRTRLFVEGEGQTRHV